MPVGVIISVIAGEVEGVYFASVKCEVSACLYVCLSLQSRFSKTICPYFAKFSVHVIGDWSCSSSDNNVLLVLCTTCFHIGGGK